MSRSEANFRACGGFFDTESGEHVHCSMRYGHEQGCDGVQQSSFDAERDPDREGCPWKCADDAPHCLCVRKQQLPAVITQNEGGMTNDPVEAFGADSLDRALQILEEVQASGDPERVRRFNETVRIAHDAVKAGEKRERDEIVAYMRDPKRIGGSVNTQLLADIIAGYIERGEHRAN